MLSIPNSLKILAILAGLSACSTSESEAPQIAPSAADGADAEEPEAQPDVTETEETTIPSTHAGNRVSCKRGGGYGYHSMDDLKAFSKGASWWYNWTSAPDKGVRNGFQDLGMEFVPMIWNGSFKVDKVIADIPDGSKYLLAFNEPNFKSQANLSPSQAAALWPKVENIAKAKNLKIVAPGVNYCGPAANCHETDPYKYLDKFFEACKGCKVDYLSVHWYACKGEYLEDYLKGFERFNKPLWVTEFACGDGNAEEKSLEGQKQYMAEALNILENSPLVFRYAWFSSRTTAIPNVDLFADSGVLSDLGEQYMGAPAVATEECNAK